MGIFDFFKKKKEGFTHNIDISNLNKQNEDDELAIEKLILCDDGVKRIYRGEMFGIIKEQIGTSETINSNKDNFIKNPSFSSTLVVKSEKWFTSSGEYIPKEEVINCFFERRALISDYNERYGLSNIPARIEEYNSNIITHIRSEIINIDGFWFELTEEPFRFIDEFSGKLYGINYLNGVKA
jgi:hypothetical protein